MNRMVSEVTRSWQVLLLGGASGSGKTSVSYRLANHFKVGITEIDDFQVILEGMTTPEQQPELHWWRTHPDPMHLPADEIVEHTIAVCRVMATAVEAVIANHLESRAPVVLEGDFSASRVVLTVQNAIPRTSSGKVQRQLCRERLLTSALQRHLARPRWALAWIRRVLPVSR